MAASSSPNSGAQSRAAAATIIFRILEQGESLGAIFDDETTSLSANDKRLTQAIVYGVLRHLPSLNGLVSAKLDKPLKGKLKVLNSLLLVGAYQLYRLRTKDHAAVSATVEAAKKLKKKNQTGLVNGVLRQLLREAPAVTDDGQRPLPTDALADHPRWLVERLKHDYPTQWQDILAQNNVHPPMWLRVNCAKTPHTSDYLAELSEVGIEAVTDNVVNSALRLTQATSVERLPGFAEGRVSIQDRSAQLAANFLAAEPSHRVLDCCAAPGGKTLHLLEQHSFEQPVTAIDVDNQRLDRLRENLVRMDQKAKVICADINQPGDWWDGQLFDRILLDAPCSGTGVIRRHPDIKWLRRATDIDSLTQLQASILDTLWPLLAPGGELLYATCSVLKAENDEQISGFLERQSDARLVPISEGIERMQILPEAEDGDGFFYAKLKKHT